jgi:hypothetical protein|tara:strand:- start:1202 stop:1369 length:168 start_codon:yes stop_codon:yes gene_type:complete
MLLMVVRVVVWTVVGIVVETMGRRKCVLQTTELRGQEGIPLHTFDREREGRGGAK